MAEKDKAQVGGTATQAKAGEPEPQVEAGDARELAKVDVKERFIDKVNQGNFTFNEDEIRALAAELGVEDDVADAGPFRTFEGEGSQMAGLTPSTGSGGRPYEAEAATDDTKKYAQERAKAADDDKAGLTELQKADARRLARSVE